MRIPTTNSGQLSDNHGSATTKPSVQTMLRLSKLLPEPTRLSVLGIDIIESVYENWIQDQPLLTIVHSCVVVSMTIEHNGSIQQCLVLLM